MIKKVVAAISIMAAISTGFAQSADPLTGRLQYSVPIGNIQALDLNIPIGLYHHGNAVQVAEGNDDAGLGWSLSGSGSVTRIVRGLPDDLNQPNRKGWLYAGNAQTIQAFAPQADDNLAICTDEEADFNALESLTANMVNDTEPDLFYVQAPGLSAQFVFGADGQPKLLVHQNITIQFTNGNFIVKGNGLTYNFSTREMVTRNAPGTSASGVTGINSEWQYFNQEISFAGRWHLSSIQSITTGANANFLYAPAGETRSVRYLSIDSLSQIHDTRNPLRLSLISLTSYTASMSITSYT
ncbi:MAG: hypothetical protein ACKOE6_12015, partial [Flammeovirgaceae bacterium]